MKYTTKNAIQMQYTTKHAIHINKCNKIKKGDFLVSFFYCDFGHFF